MLENSVLANLRNAFSSAVQPIFIDSLKRTLMFREPSVKEHISLAKTVISNKDSQSIVYAATLMMIKNLCLDEQFDPMEMSEFDRLKIIVHLFSNNFFSKILNIKCPRKGCNSKITYEAKYGTLLKMLDSVDCSDMTFSNETEMGKLRLFANFPKTSRYLSLLKKIDGIDDLSLHTPSKQSNYDDMDKSFSELSSNKSQNSADEDFANKIRMRRDILKGKIKKTVEKKNDLFGNVDLKNKTTSGEILLDLADIYINRIQITDIKGSDNEFDIDMSSFDYDETEKVLSALPMTLFVKEDGMNAIKFVSKGLFEKMNACVPEIRCPTCGCEISKRLTLQDFFIFG